MGLRATRYVVTLVDDKECARMAKKEGVYNTIMANVQQAKLSGKLVGANYDFTEYLGKFVAYVFYWGNEDKQENGWIRLEGNGFSKEEMERLNQMMIKGLNFTEFFSVIEDMNRN